MSQPPSSRGYRFPPEIISHAVWLYHRFGLSCRDVEDLLAERGVSATYESIRQWCLTFGLDYARRLRRRRSPYCTQGTFSAPEGASKFAEFCHDAIDTAASEPVDTVLRFRRQMQTRIRTPLGLGHDPLTGAVVRNPRTRFLRASR
jgi:transposase-like protein